MGNRLCLCSHNIAHVPPIYISGPTDQTISYVKYKGMMTVFIIFVNSCPVKPLYTGNIYVSEQFSKLIGIH